MTNSLQPTELLEKVDHLNKTIEMAGVALGVYLLEVKEQEIYKQLGYDEFWQYYSDHLGRTKGQISKLLKVGEFFKRAGLRADTEVPYTKLEAAIRAFPNKEPDYIIAAAQTNTLAELESGRQEEKAGVHEHQTGEERWAKCTLCDKFMKL